MAEDGCLEVRSHAVGESYWPERSDALGGGVFRTLDLAEISEEFLYLRGRASDRINVAGRKVSPEAIERVLGQHPAVRECLVFGVPSTEMGRGEMIVACVAPGAALAPEMVREFLVSRLPSWQVPREWWFLETLAVNDRGKLSRAEWRARYAAWQSGTVGGSNGPTRLNGFSPA